MKYAMFFLLCCVALAAAAPQLISPWGGYVAPGFGAWAPRTLVAGPTVLNGALPAAYSGRIITNGLYGPAII